MADLPRMHSARALQNLTHFGRAVHLLVCIFVLIGCQSDALEITATQRALGEVTSDELDLTLSLSPGILRDINVSTRTITGRASAGVGALTIRTGPDSPEQLTLELRNVHPRAELLARRTRTITSSETLGERCVQADTDLIDVNCAQDPLSSSQCPRTTVTRLSATRASFTLPVSPCIETTYELRLPPELAREELSFVVIGSLDRSDVLAKIQRAELAASKTHDFFMVLGDAIEKQGNGFVSDLEDQIDELETLVIITPGEEEIGEDRGQYFERRFGAFEYRWTVKNVQFISFYSARQQLDERSLGALRSSLRAMQAEEQQWRTSRGIVLEEGEARALPAFAMTHTPLFDPKGPRQAGFTSRLEAGQVSSLLANASVHTVFAGHILDNAHVTTISPNLVLTASQDTRPDEALAVYRRVTISDMETSGSLRVGSFFMKLETLSVP